MSIRSPRHVHLARTPPKTTQIRRILVTTTTGKPVRYCIGCDRPMWSMSPDELDIPAVKHASKGRCDACYSADRRAGRGTLRTYGNALTDQDMRNLRQHHPAMYAWHVDRRNRGIPAEGLRKEEPMMAPCNASVDCLHYECLDCHRPVRRKGVPLADHPGTISGFVKRRLCESHYLARQQPVPKPHQSDIYHKHNVRNLENFMARIRGKSRVRA